MISTYRYLLNKIVCGNEVARKLLLYLTHSSMYGEALLNVLDKSGMRGVRIEHLYNALRQDEKEFVRYVYLIATRIDKEEVVKAKTLSDFLNIVRELQPLYDNCFSN